MAQLVDLDPRLADWAETEAQGRSCECCGVLAKHDRVARYPMGFMCDDCADRHGFDTEG